MRILLTGASGFIGRGLLPLLLARGDTVRIAVRRHQDIAFEVEQAVVGSFSADTKWEKAVADCDVVIHLAGLAHVLNKAEANKAKPFFDVNLDATIGLARAAQAAGVKQFIFMSSIGVHGTASQTPLTEDSSFSPHTPYAASKADAERALRKLCGQSPMAFTIVRPPLVYGTGVGGNFRRLMKLVETGLPLPLGSATQPRSMISRNNLNHFVLHCVGNAKAYNQAFLVADNEQTSTRSLVENLAQVMNKKILILPAPVGLMHSVLCKIGRRTMADGLFSPLVISTDYAQQVLGWRAPYAQIDEINIAVQE